MAKKTYAEKKAEARSMAIEWQMEFAEKQTSYAELYESAIFFEKIGRRYGLLREFRENAVI